MKNRSFPHSGATTSRLGIGAMSFSNFYGEVSREEVFAILDAARDLGVSHIDTASVYGMGGSELISVPIWHKTRKHDRSFTSPARAE